MDCMYDQFAGLFLSVLLSTAAVIAFVSPLLLWAYRMLDKELSALRAWLVGALTVFLGGVCFVTALAFVVSAVLFAAASMDAYEKCASALPASGGAVAVIVAKRPRFRYTRSQTFL